MGLTVWPAPCGQAGCLAHYPVSPPGCECPAFFDSGGWHLAALDGDCPAHVPPLDDLPLQHVIYCAGCRRAWFDPPGNTTCTCQTPGPYYERWLVDPDPAVIPPEAWRALVPALRHD